MYNSVFASSISSIAGCALRIRVMFVQDVLPRYRAGEVWSVAGGYARNYLIPRGMAVPATRDQLQRAEKLRAAAEVRRDVEVKDLRAFGEKVEGATLTLRARAGDEGRLYGSVTAAGIAEELTRLVGREVDRRLVQLAAPIKEIGEYEVPVRLHMEVVPTITVVVEAEGRTAEAQQPTASDSADATESEEEAPATSEEAEEDEEKEDG